MNHRPGRPSIHLRERAKRHVSLLPLLGLIPSFLLAIYSMTEPWARARVIGVFGISRSPEATLLIAISLAGMVGASVAVATRGRRPGLACGVHVVTGALMMAIAWAAFGMVRRASVKVLFIPIASVRPGQGLRHFLLASILVITLAAIEGVMAIARGHASGAARTGVPLEERSAQGR